MAARYTPRLLLVEDDSESARMLAAMFADGYELLLATNGARALELALACAPDAILLDVMMPGMDGFECCTRLKADPRTAQVPVILMTGMDRAQAETRGLALGAADFVAKPLNPLVLQRRVQIQVELKRARDELLLLAATDGLTGLANRRQFDQVLQREYARLARCHGELSLLLVDIDHFKVFNDCYGHLSGDDCLRAVAREIAAAAKRPADLAARYGGEEFACVLPDTGAEGAAVIAERVRRAIAGLDLSDLAAAGSAVAAAPASRTAGHALADPALADPAFAGLVAAGPRVTASIGSASCMCRPGGSALELIAAADRQLYGAKQDGRNRVRSA